jgi:hypothetical protein
MRMASAVLFTAVSLAAVLLTAVLVLIIMLVAWAYQRHRSSCKKIMSTRYPRSLISTVYPTMKTGDILLFTPTVSYSLTSSYFGKKFVHMGLVVEDNAGNLLIAETTPFRHLDVVAQAGGMLLVPLLATIKHYSGSVSIQQLRRRLDRQQVRAIYKAAVAAVGTPYPTFRETVATLLRGGHHAHCYDIVAHLLRAGGINIPMLGTLALYEYLTELSSTDLKDHKGVQIEYTEIHDLIYDIDAS